MLHSPSIRAFIRPIWDRDGRTTRIPPDFRLWNGVVQNSILGAQPNSDTYVRTEYRYDALGNLKKIIDANGHETTFDHNVLNRLWKVTNPIARVTEYGYDALGNRTSLKDANITNTIYVYDLTNRLQIIDYLTGSDVGFGYDVLGRLTWMGDGLGHTTWVYDDLDRITSVNDPFDQNVGYGYDADGKRTSIAFPDPINKVCTNQCNPLDQLDMIWDSSTLLVDYDYDIAGRLERTTLANGVTSTPGYDLSSQLTNAEVA